MIFPYFSQPVPFVISWITKILEYLPWKDPEFYQMSLYSVDVLDTINWLTYIQTSLHHRDTLHEHLNDTLNMHLNFVSNVYKFYQYVFNIDFLSSFSPPPPPPPVFELCLFVFVIRYDIIHKINLELFSSLSFLESLRNF